MSSANSKSALIRLMIMKHHAFLKSICLAVLLSFLLQPANTFASDLPADTNESICNKKFCLAASLKLHERHINEVVVEIAKSFLGTNYSANTIEAPGQERLIINLQTFDCVTFYESSLALARCIKKTKLTFEDYKKELQFVRYRNGIIDGYTSRLHYTSDYFYNNENKGVLKNITKELGGVQFKKKINFMSTHPDLYTQLKENPEYLKVIRKIEDSINARTMYYIPKANIKKIASQIKNGDIIGITTNIDGLDCTHTGIAIWQNRILYMIHTPIPGSKVQITELPLWKYLSKIKKDTGIMVARPVEP
jgi:hypothetical protein